MNKLFAALIAGAFALSTSAMAQDKTPEPQVKAPTKAERAAAKEAKAKAKAANEQKTVGEVKAEKKAKAEKKLSEGSATQKQGDQTPGVMSNTSKSAPRETKAERAQDNAATTKMPGKGGQ